MKPFKVVGVEDPDYPEPGVIWFEAIPGGIPIPGI